MMVRVGEEELEASLHCYLLPTNHTLLTVVSIVTETFSSLHMLHYFNTFRANISVH